MKHLKIFINELAFKFLVWFGSFFFNHSVVITAEHSDCEDGEYFVESLLFTDDQELADRYHERLRTELDK